MYVYAYACICRHTHELVFCVFMRQRNLQSQIQTTEQKNLLLNTYLNLFQKVCFLFQRTKISSSHVVLKSETITALLVFWCLKCRGLK